MFTSFGEFLTCVKEARFTFGVIWQAIVSFFEDVIANPDVSAVKDALLNVIQPIYSIALIVGIVLALIMAFFGKKIMGAINFVLFFALGFLLGTHLLAPLLPPDIALPGWIIGVVLALILAVLSKFIYIAFYAVAGGYSVYVLAYYGFFIIEAPTFSNSRAIGCLIAALVAVVILFVFKKYIEMLITSVLGAWLAVLAFIRIYDFTAWSIFAGMEWLAILIFSAIIAVLGLAVQVKTRKRY